MRFGAIVRFILLQTGCQKVQVAETTVFFCGDKVPYAITHHDPITTGISYTELYIVVVVVHIFVENFPISCIYFVTLFSL